MIQEAAVTAAEAATEKAAAKAATAAAKAAAEAAVLAVGKGNAFDEAQAEAQIAAAAIAAVAQIAEEPTPVARDLEVDGTNGVVPEVGNRGDAKKGDAGSSSIPNGTGAAGS